MYNNATAVIVVIYTSSFTYHTHHNIPTYINYNYSTRMYWPRQPLYSATLVPLCIVSLCRSSLADRSVEATVAASCNRITERVAIAWLLTLNIRKYVCLSLISLVLHFVNSFIHELYVTIVFTFLQLMFVQLQWMVLYCMVLYYIEIFKVA